MGKDKKEKTNSVGFFSSLFTNEDTTKAAKDNIQKLKSKCNEVKNMVHSIKAQKENKVNIEKINENVNKHYFNIGALYIQGNYSIDDFHITSYETQIERIKNSINDIYARYKKEGGNK